MTLVPTLRNAELSFRAGSVDLPLEPFVGKRQRSEGSRDPASAEGEPSGQRALIAPKIAAPDVGDSFEMAPVRELALRELIRQADSGKLRVAIPLPKQKLSYGPVSIDLTAGHSAVIELEIDTARVLRKKAKGTVEPPIRMPLGVSFQGLYLNDDGEVIADIANFPDLKLSRWVPQIPSTLDELLDLLFPEEKPKEASEPKKEKREDRDPIDLSGLTIEARTVRPRCTEPLDLGRVGSVMLGNQTKIDVEYSSTALVIRGHVHVERAQIAGLGFTLEGVTASGNGEWRMIGQDGQKEMYLGVSEASLRVERARISLGEGSELVFGPTSLSDVEIVVRSGGQPELTLSAEQITTELASGRLAFTVGGKPAAAELAPARASGKAMYRRGKLTFDLAVEGASATVPQMTADLGLVELDVTQLIAGGSGRLSGSLEELSFSGDLEATADVASSHLMLGELGATLAPGSRGTIRVTELEADRSGLIGMIASAALSLRLHSGSIPLGPKAVLRFSAGAEGTVDLHTLALGAGQRWPYVDGSVRLEAGSDPVAIEGMVEIPAGRAKVQARLTLDPTGHLVLSDLDMNLSA